MNNMPVLPGYDQITDCLYKQFLDEAGQEFDYDSYNQALGKIQLVTDKDQYTELEDIITEGFENSAKQGFTMGIGIALSFLFGGQQAFSSKENRKGGTKSDQRIE